MHVLLVEPPYKIKRARNLPIALQKIATKHLLSEDRVRFVKGQIQPSLFNSSFSPDIIYITTLFTYYAPQTIKCIQHYQQTFPNCEIQIGGVLATLHPEYIQKHTGISPFIGVSKEIDSYLPNYDLFTKYESYQYNDFYGIIFTSRGCVRKCEFCSVRKIEPDFYVIPNWKEQILHAVKNNCTRLLIQDNNFTATPFKHQKEVVDFIIKTSPNIEVDFNQAVDCRLFKQKHADLYSKLNLFVLRFAFDGMQEDGFFQQAIQYAKNAGIGMKNGDIFLIYTLYNFTDDPAQLWYRVNEIIKSGAASYLMRYTPINTFSKTAKRLYIGEKWTEKQIWNFAQIMRHLARAQILPSRKHIIDYFSQGPNFFIEQLNSKEIKSTTQWKRNITECTMNKLL